MQQKLTYFLRALACASKKHKPVEANLFKENWGLNISDSLVSESFQVPPIDPGVEVVSEIATLGTSVISVGATIFRPVLNYCMYVGCLFTNWLHLAKL